MNLIAAYDRMIRVLMSLGLIVVLGIAGYAGFRFTQAQITADLYHHRLIELNNHYAQLRNQYNEAVRQTAVTELVVEDGSLSVHIRTAEGIVERVPTSLDPRQEIYVDYVVVDGRLWIRRVFDDMTPPISGITIDPSLGTIDWDSPHVSHGKAVYRRLNEGRWIVTVTGSGALGLTRVNDDQPVTLAPPPNVRDYEQIEAEVADRVSDISPADVLRHLIDR